VIESEADRLAMIQAVGEPFSTAKAEKLWLIFDRDFIEQQLGPLSNEGRRPMGLARTSDVALHELVKESKVTRDLDGEDYFVKRLEADGTGMTLLVFKA
jgi:hypothetical protein